MCTRKNNTKNFLINGYDEKVFATVMCNFSFNERMNEDSSLKKKTSEK